MARDLLIIFANVLHLYIQCIVADVARLLQSFNACLMVIEDDVDNGSSDDDDDDDVDDDDNSDDDDDDDDYI